MYKFLISLMTFIIFISAVLKADESWPPLHRALEKQEFEKANQIIKSKVKQVNLTTPTDQEFVLRTAWLFEKTRKYINDKSGVQINPNYIGYSALEVAIIYGAPVELIKKLIDLGQNVNLMSLQINANKDFGKSSNNNQAEMWVRTPLFEAMEYNKNPEVVQLLIDNGADLEHVLWLGSYFQHFFNVDFGGHWNNFDQVSEQPLNALDQK